MLGDKKINQSQSIAKKKRILTAEGWKRKNLATSLTNKKQITPSTDSLKIKRPA